MGRVTSDEQYELRVESFQHGMILQRIGDSTPRKDGANARQKKTAPFPCPSPDDKARRRKTESGMKGKVKLLLNTQKKQDECQTLKNDLSGHQTNAAKPLKNDSSDECSKTAFYCWVWLSSDPQASRMFPPVNAVQCLIRPDSST